MWVMCIVTGCNIFAFENNYKEASSDLFSSLEALLNSAIVSGFNEAHRAEFWVLLTEK